MSFIADCITELTKIIDSEPYQRFENVFAENKKFILIGNGGSNSIASHISQDYVKKCRKHSLSFADPSMLTCFINDFGMEYAYVKFLDSYADDDTVIILISSSGESDNILNCIKYCEFNNMKYGILTGFDKNNTARKIADNPLFDYHVDSSDYGIVECVHQIFLHGVVK